MSAESGGDRFSIRILEELTGVPATTLRAWERRYGLLIPERSAGGHRLYSGADLLRVREVQRLLKQKVRMGEAAGRVLSGGTEDDARGAEGGGWPAWPGRVRDMLRAVQAFDEQELDKLYSEVLSLHPMDEVLDKLLRPVLRLLGEHWREHAQGIAEEHFFASHLRNSLASRLRHEASRPRGRRLLVACLPGEYHDLGLMMFVLAAIGRGYRVLWLGANLPLEQIGRVVAGTDVAGVLLSGSVDAAGPAEAREVLTQLAALHASLPVPLFLGGHFSVRERKGLLAAGVQPLGEEFGPALEALEAHLPAHRPP